MRSRAFLLTSVLYLGTGLDKVALPAEGQPAPCPCRPVARAALRASATEPEAAATELPTLERSVLRRAGIRQGNLKPADYGKLVKAARDYATAIAGDDNSKFTALASSALQQAVAVQLGIDRQLDMSQTVPSVLSGLAQPELRVRGTPNFEPGIWEQASFQANFRNLLERASKPEADLVPIIGPPSSTIARIVGPGSREAKDNEFLDCVCIGRRVGSVDQYCCTGTLVGKNVVVTAGHCFFCGGAGPNAVVFVGNNINQTGRTYTGKIIRHPKYNQDGLHNDLSVIILSEDVEGVAPRRIGTTDEIDHATFVRAVGFGNSDFASTSGFGIKRLVDVPVASIACGRPDDPQSLGCDANLELVAGFVGLGPDSCNGDSGGPVYILLGNDARDPNAWVLAGATSRATDAGTQPCGDGGIYVRLDKYVEFIRNLPDARF